MTIDAQPPHASEPVAPKRASRWRRRFIAVGGLYLVWLVMCFGFHLVDSMVLFPTTRPIPMSFATERPIELKDGTSLQIWTARSAPARVAQPAAFVLEFTGNATRAEHVVEGTTWTWGQHAVEVWAVNYPGYGNSDGPARLKTVASSALEAYDALRAQAGDRPIFVVGTSLGSTAALHLAANRPTAGMVIVNPPALRQIVRGEFGWWNLWLLATPASFCIPGELDSLANAKRVTAPAVIVTSAKDSVVPFKNQQSVVDAYAGTKHVISLDADHNDEWTDSTQRRMAREIEWLWSTAFPTTRP